MNMPRPMKINLKRLVSSIFKDPKNHKNYPIKVVFRLLIG